MGSALRARGGKAEWGKAGDRENVGSDPRTNADRPTGYQRLGPSEPISFELRGRRASTPLLAS